MLHNAPLLHLIERGGYRLPPAPEQRLVIRVAALSDQKLLRDATGSECFMRTEQLHYEHTALTPEKLTGACHRHRRPLIVPRRDVYARALELADR